MAEVTFGTTHLIAITVVGTLIPSSGGRKAIYDDGGLCLRFLDFCLKELDGTILPGEMDGGHITCMVQAKDAERATAWLAENGATPAQD